MDAAAGRVSNPATTSFLEPPESVVPAKISNVPHTVERIRTPFSTTGELLHRL
jgi:hypothetical protein